MQGADAFSSYHPLVNFIYFLLVLLFSMFFQHPVCLLLSLLTALIYAARLESLRRLTWALLPLVLLTALLNPLFNHRGSTLICYLPGGNPLTAESLAFGAAAGVMIAAVLLWFRCYQCIVTNDKFVYLFGRLIPALSLVLSLTLRFIPRLLAQLRLIVQGQRALGRDPEAAAARGPKAWLARARSGLSVLSILTTWALENAVATSDSMRSRGYGLPGRSSFAAFRWQKRDTAALALLLLLSSGIVSLKLAGLFTWRYYPRLSGDLTTPAAFGLYFMYLLLLTFPLLADFREERRWTPSRSKI